MLTTSLKPFAVLLVAVSALAGAPAASADLADEQELANRHAPVVRLVEQVEECGYGEPYEPLDVDALFDEPTVALRGPWNRFDLVEIGPSADDLVDLYEYHLDFPGDALDPGCSYELWARRVTAERAPAVYAHVATEEGRPDRLALQYWFFYAYNDWNNLHEGDWENVQLIFDAGDAREALTKTPVEVGYSQHEGSEGGEWDDDKLELVDGTRPVVYPAAGSHANFFDEGLYLGSSAEQGVGCDDTRGPHLELQPRVVTIPSDFGDAREAYRGSRSRAGGVSSRTRSSTARRGRTSRNRGRSRSARPRAGATGATPCPPAESSAPVRRTSSATPSRRGPAR